jgi:hypothetical protein
MRAQGGTFTVQHSRNGPHYANPKCALRFFFDGLLFEFFETAFVGILLHPSGCFFLTASFATDQNRRPQPYEHPKKEPRTLERKPS